jgi:hypothetical protein
MVVRKFPVITKKEKDELWRRLVAYRASSDVEDYEGSPGSVPIFEYIEQMLIRRQRKNAVKAR